MGVCGFCWNLKVLLLKITKVILLHVQCILYIMDTLGQESCCYTEVSFMWRLFYTVRNVIGTLGAVR